MAPGNYNKPVVPRRADVPKQRGKGKSVPKSSKVARAYKGAVTGKKPSGKK